MKQHTKGADYSTETEMEVQDGLDKNTFTDMGLHLQGELITERCIILKDPGCEVVLDKNDYLGHTDFELEIEYSPDHEEEASMKLGTITNRLICAYPALTFQNILRRCQNKE
ncbi:MAG: hypothetical protein IJW92_04660 [Clostridia bacterium]|nr:hypothetical protein [Clostridia bacterium]